MIHDNLLQQAVKKAEPANTSSGAAATQRGLVTVRKPPASPQSSQPVVRHGNLLSVINFFGLLSESHAAANINIYRIFYHRRRTSRELTRSPSVRRIWQIHLLIDPSISLISRRRDASVRIMRMKRILKHMYMRENRKKRANTRMTLMTTSQISKRRRRKNEKLLKRIIVRKRLKQKTRGRK